jgi:hypothetical protein
MSLQKNNSVEMLFSNVFFNLTQNILTSILINNLLPIATTFFNINNIQNTSNKPNIQNTLKKKINQENKSLEINKSNKTENIQTTEKLNNFISQIKSNKLYFIVLVSVIIIYFIYQIYYKIVSKKNQLIMSLSKTNNKTSSHKKSSNKISSFNSSSNDFELDPEKVKKQFEKNQKNQNQKNQNQKNQNDKNKKYDIKSYLLNLKKKISKETLLSTTNYDY